MADNRKSSSGKQPQKRPAGSQGRARQNGTPNRSRSTSKDYSDGFEYLSSSSGGRGSFQDISSFSSKQDYDSRNRQSDGYEYKQRRQAPQVRASQGRASQGKASQSARGSKAGARQQGSYAKSAPQGKKAPSNGAKANTGKKYKSYKKKHTARNVVLSIVCVLLIGIVGLFFWIYSKLDTNYIPRSNSALGISSAATDDFLVRNIAFFGVDARSADEVARSDAVMVVSVDHRNGKIKMMSILRDSCVNIDGYGEDKLNHAYAFGGPELAIKTLNENYNLNIRDYVTVNFTKMASIVDAFGGTEVYVTDEEVSEINRNLDMYKYDDPDSVVWDADYLSSGGNLLLNGNQAVAYSRIRDIGGDEARAQRQRTVLSGLFSRLGKLNIKNYMTLINDVLPMCQTSLSAGRLLSCAPILLRGMNIENLAVPTDAVEAPSSGYTDAGGWVFIYDLEYASQHIDAFIYEKKSDYWGMFENAIISQRS